MVSIVQMLASPLSPPVGAYLFKTGGYVCVFSAQTVILVIAALYLVWKIRAYQWKPSKKTVGQSHNIFNSKCYF